MKVVNSAVGDTRDELIATTVDWNAAILANDADQIAAFVTEDWVLVSDSGVSTHEQFLSLVRAGTLTHSAMAPVGESRIRIFGDTAVVTARVISTAHYLGERSDADEWSTDVFVRTSDGWRCALTHITAARKPAPKSR